MLSRASAAGGTTVTSFGRTTSAATGKVLNAARPAYTTSTLTPLRAVPFPTMQPEDGTSPDDATRHRHVIASEGDQGHA